MEINECEHENIIPTNGFYTCINCGLVIDRKIIGEHLYNRYINKKHYLEQTKIEPRYGTVMSRFKLGEVGKRRKYLLSGTNENTNNEAKNSRLRKCLIKCVRTLNIPNPEVIIRSTLAIMQKHPKLYTTNRGYQILASALIVALRQMKWVIPIKTICHWFIAQGHIRGMKSKNLINLFAGFSTNIPKPSLESYFNSYIPKILACVEGIHSDTQELINESKLLLKDEKHLCGKNPINVIGAIFYIVLNKLGYGISYVKLETILGITQHSIRPNVKIFRDMKEIII